MTKTLSNLSGENDTMEPRQFLFGPVQMLPVADAPGLITENRIIRAEDHSSFSQIINFLTIAEF